MPQGKYSTAEGRWAGVGPYYAMFPTEFADEVIRTHSRPGDLVLDPFAGRFTSIFSAATNGRRGMGIEVNPVGWVYGKAKLRTADEQEVISRLRSIAAESKGFSRNANRLPEFFHHCYSRKVRMFLLAARSLLDWRRRSSDWTLMAILLVYLHGKLGQALSNQMRQAKSMAPEYSIKWWTERNLEPPDVDPVDFLAPRIAWRYAKGRPVTGESQLYLGNCGPLLTRMGGLGSVRLLFTSPPYYGVTNYHYDQWIRLWLLGSDPLPVASHSSIKGRFNNGTAYKRLLLDTFQRAAPLLTEDATVYVRTDKREFTYNTTVAVLNQVFPTKRSTVTERPFLKDTQTRLFGDHSTKEGEVDILLQSR